MQPLNMLCLKHYFLILFFAWVRLGFAEQRFYQATNLWRINIGYYVQSSPAMGGNGVIYVTGREGCLYAINSDGQYRWQYHINADTVSTPAVGPDDSVYFGARDRQLHAVDLNGQRKWTFKTGRWIDASPALAEDGSVYFGSWDGNFYALTKEGQEKWRFKTGGPIVSSAAVSRTGDVIFGCYDQRVYCLTAVGAKRWEFKTQGAVIASPTIGSNGETYCASVDGKLYALNADGMKLWELQTGSTTASSPVLDDHGNLFLCITSNYLAVSASGKELWRWRIWEHPRGWQANSSGLILANGHVVFSTWDCRVLAIAPDGDWVWSFWLDGPSVSSPLVGPDGIIYAMGFAPGLKALDRNVPLAKTAWPMFRANPQRTGRVSSVR